MKHTVGKVPRAYEEKGAYEGQNEVNIPLKKFLLWKYQKLPRAHESLNTSLV